jgi:hypothetical protein
MPFLCYGAIFAAEACLFAGRYLATAGVLCWETLKCLLEPSKGNEVSDCGMQPFGGVGGAKYPYVDHYDSRRVVMQKLATRTFTNIHKYKCTLHVRECSLSSCVILKFERECSHSLLSVFCIS